jgi:hypothetical protein
MVVVIDATMFIVLGVFSLIVFYFLLVLHDAWNTRRLRKKYKEENDLSKSGEKNRNKTGRVPFTDIRERYPPLVPATNPTDTDGKPVVEGHDKLEGGELLQTASSDDAGKNSNSNGKAITSIDKFRGIFKRGK